MGGSVDDTSELIRRARDGDESGLNELFERYSPRLLARIRLMMGDAARRHAESGDFLQGVFVEVIRGLDRFEPRGADAFLRWAGQIARNNIRDQLRRKRELSLATFAEKLGGGDDAIERPDGKVEHMEMVDRLVDAIGELPEDQQRVVELRQFEGLSFTAIGEQLGRSENAAQLLHGRAMIALGARFKRLR